MTKALPGLLTKIENEGAKNLVESSVFYVGESLAGIMKDPVLSGFPFEKASFAEIVYRVIKSGTVFERSALGKHLTPKAASFFPSVRDQVDKSFDVLQTSIEEIFKPMFRLLTDHYGVPFNGDQNSVAYTIINEYGGLSFADFLIFFERAKTGRYRQDYQHIATRGINADFLFSWLDQYVEEKTADVDEMYNRFKEPSSKVKPDPFVAERLKKAREEKEVEERRRSDLENQAQAIRGKFESSLYESTVVTQWFKWSTVEVPKVDDFGQVYDGDGYPVRTKIKQEIICSSDDPDRGRSESLPFRVEKSGTVERLVKRAIFEFVTFRNSNETVRFYNEVKARIWEKYNGEENQNEHVEAEFKIILSTISSVKRVVTAEKLIEQDIVKRYPTAGAKQVAEYVSTTIRGFEDAYYTEYLPDCIAKDYPALKKVEFIYSAVLEVLVSHGLSNPVKTAFE